MEKNIHTVSLFPEVKSCLIPVLGDVIKIIGDDGPDRRCHGRSAPIRNHPSRIGYEGAGSQCWSITLRSPPGSCERSTVTAESETIDKDI